MVHSVTIILESLSHLKNLCTTTSGGDILHFDRRKGNRILFL
jgi:hypothetical protein